MDIIMIGYAGQSRLAALARANRQTLLGYLPSEIVESASTEGREYRIPDEVRVIARTAVGEGGVLRALWLIAEKLQCGFTVDLLKIPIRQECVEVCGILEEDPFRLPARGSWLIAAESAQRELEILRRKNIPAACVGCTTASPARTLRLARSERYLESGDI